MPAIWRSITRIHIAAASVVGICLLAPAAQADDTGQGGLPNFQMFWDASHDNIPGWDDYVPHGTVAFGTYNLGGGPNGVGGAPRVRTGWRYQGSFSNEFWGLAWDCVVNPDPFVDATITVTNNSLATQTFLVFMPLVIAPPVLPLTEMSGSVSAVVTDSDFSGAGMLTATPAEPVYQGYIDTMAQMNARMWNPGYFLSPPGAGQSANDNNTFGSQVGPPAVNQIALRLMFNLSPGDSASVTGIFEIQPIPGPAGLSLLAIFAAFARRRRRG